MTASWEALKATSNLMVLSDGPMSLLVSRVLILDSLLSAVLTSLIAMTPIEAGAQKLYKVNAATWRKCCHAGPTENEDMEDEETVDAEAFDDNDKSFSQFDIAIIGGKKIKREEDMD